MEIGVVTEGIAEPTLARFPWIYFRQALAEDGIHITVHDGHGDAFRRPFDAMLLHVWQHWGNRQRFVPSRILPIMEQYAIYRAEFPETVQIILNHTDMSRRPYATPYWRPGDPVLYRTPAYDRSELYPFPADTIWPIEMIVGAPSFVSATPPRFKAGFVGSNTGPRGYRDRVAAACATVGIGICAPERPYPKAEYDQLMAACEIVVCPRGWGENSFRHWDTWRSGKPMLTDRECDSVEMIPGIRLRDGVHYLVFDEPEQIPDIVSDWTRPSRRADLAQIAENGRQAALSYDARAHITAFFARAVGHG